MTENVSAKHKGRGSEATKNGSAKAVQSIKAETNGTKMMRLGENVIKTALKDSNLAQTRNFNHILNLKYTCRALPSCLKRYRQTILGKIYFKDTAIFCFKQIIEFF